MQTEGFTLSGAAAARRIGVSANTIKDLARSGELRHLRLPSGRFRFRPADVDEFVEAHVAGGGGEAA